MRQDFWDRKALKCSLHIHLETREVITSLHIYNLLGTGRLEVGTPVADRHEGGDVEAVDYVNNYLAILSQLQRALAPPNIS